MPEGTQFAERGPIPGGMSNLLRGATDMPGGYERTPYLEEIWAEREEESGDGVQCVYGENQVKATLSSGGWTYHHNGINLQLHRIFRQSGMVNDI